MEPHQIVMDTNVLYSALRSNRGASYRLLSLVDTDKFQINISVSLIIEYEDVLKRKKNELIFNDHQIDQLLDYLCLIGKWHEVYFLWRPILKDPEDDMLLELAVRARCKYIITYNKDDFKPVTTFGIKAVTAKEYLQIIKEIP